MLAIELQSGQFHIYLALVLVATLGVIFGWISVGAEREGRAFQAIAVMSIGTALGTVCVTALVLVHQSWTCWVLHERLSVRQIP
ncbi:MAG: hypothetical protein LH471_00795 [Salinibacterium sp.]|nr:hypothetical protein [Salinibacterium sp.]